MKPGTLLLVSASKQVSFLSAFVRDVCLCMCVSAQKLQNYGSEIDETC